MGKAERRVSLTKEEIKALCEEAADKAVERSEKARKKSIAQAVSYTHLTLPTICSV